MGHASWLPVVPATLLVISRLGICLTLIACTHFFLCQLTSGVGRKDHLFVKALKGKSKDKSRSWLVEFCDVLSTKQGHDLLWLIREDSSCFKNWVEFMICRKTSSFKTINRWLMAPKFSNAALNYEFFVMVSKIFDAMPPLLYCIQVTYPKSRRPCCRLLKRPLRDCQ